MAASDDLIDFNVIEEQKENIQALPSGRSAKALAQLYSPPLLGAYPSPHNLTQEQVQKRAQYEKELAAIDEADDPLDVYDRYVKWTLDAFPSAQATPQSQLLPLLERATKAFQSSSHYKNDPRHLKIWLHYIRLFSDAPREAFVFLARQGIGESLALYYEEFAAWLENGGRWSQAEEIYQLGLEKNARPAERLLRKFGEFERRKASQPQENMEPTSPALPAVRPALAAKPDPFSAAAPSPQVQTQGGASSKPKTSKLRIFSDGDAPSRPGSENSFQGWDSIGSLSNRKKENRVEVKPMAGEKLKVGKTNGGVQKMMVFKDQSLNNSSTPKHLSGSITSSGHEHQVVLNPATCRLECVFVNLEAVYPEVGDLSAEFCFEELRARHRGWLRVDWREKRANKRAAAERNQLSEVIAVDSVRSTQDQPCRSKCKTKERGFQIFEDASLDVGNDYEQVGKGNRLRAETLSAKLSLDDENDENTPPSKQEVDLAKKVRREERANRTRKIKVMDVKHIKNETQTIQLKMDSPQGPKVKRKKSIACAEPTMTINTKEAMDEIYGIFSAPLPSQTEQPDEHDEDSESDDDDDGYTTGDDSTATGKLSAPASEYGDETRNELFSSQKLPQEDDRTDVTDWSDFTTSKHVPREQDPDVSNLVDQDDDSSVHSGEPAGEDLITPVNEEEQRTRTVSAASNYRLPAEQFRDMSSIPNHRLPFMTPIVERTESSLGVATSRTEKEYFSAKTPSRKPEMPEQSEDDYDDDDNPGSSPFQDVTSDMATDKRKILQPIRTKSTKGTLALGHGTARSQTDAQKQTAATATTTDQLDTQQGPLIQDLQCNPMDPTIRQAILSQVQPPLRSYAGYHEHLDITSGRSAEIKRFARAHSKAGTRGMGGDKTTVLHPIPPSPTLDLPGAQGTYTVQRELGAGTFAPVYLIENPSAIAAADEADNDDDDDDDDEDAAASTDKPVRRRPLEALKMEEPASTWEFFMIRQSHARLHGSRAAMSVVRAHEMHLFRDECFLVEEYRGQGTLLDAVNLGRADGGGGGGMDELLAVFFTVELLRVVEALHTAHLLHGDLKADNVLVRLDPPGPETDWSTAYCPSGAHGWAAKGVCLIDFGRGVDLRRFRSDAAFVADWPPSDADCLEVRDLRPWTYQLDYHALAGVVHSLLFGKYMETTQLVTTDKTNTVIGPGAARTYRIRESLKRYWQTEMWSELFHLLLNPLSHVAGEQGAKLPVSRGLRACRERMEAWLEENCERGLGLKAMLARMECAIREKRKKACKAGAQS